MVPISYQISRALFPNPEIAQIQGLQNFRIRGNLEEVKQLVWSYKRLS